MVCRDDPGTNLRAPRRTRMSDVLEKLVVTNLLTGVGCGLDHSLRGETAERQSFKCKVVELKPLETRCWMRQLHRCMSVSGRLG
jgi:hypothetical protein